MFRMLTVREETYDRQHPEGSEVVTQVPRSGTEREFRPVKSAYRALDVLEAMSAGPATLSELGRMLDIPKSSLHGLLRTLTERGWVTTADNDGFRFRLGLRALQVGARFLDEDEVVAQVAPVLDRGDLVQRVLSAYAESGLVGRSLGDALSEGTLEKAAWFAG